MPLEAIPKALQRQICRRQWSLRGKGKLGGDSGVHLRGEVGQQKRVVAQLELVVVREQWLKFGCWDGATTK